MASPTADRPDNNPPEEPSTEVQERDDQPNAEKKEDLDIKMELLDISEFEQETHASAKDSEAFRIKTDDEGNIFVYWHYHAMTQYDPNGKIVRRSAIDKKQKIIQTKSDNEKVEAGYKEYIEYLNKIVKSRQYRGNSWSLYDAMDPDSMDELSDMAKQFIIALKKNDFNSDQANTKAWTKRFIEYNQRFIVNIGDFRNSFANPLTNYLSNKKDEKAKYNLPESFDTYNIPNLQKSLYFHEGKIFLVDWRNPNDKNTWTLQVLDKPEGLEDEITGVGMDFQENFLLIAEGKKLHVVDFHKKPMKIVHTLDNSETEFHGYLYCSNDGTILAGDKQGQMRRIMTNFNKIPSHKERVEQKKMAQRAKAIRRLKSGPKIKKSEDGNAELTAAFKELAEDMLNQFKEDIKTANTSDELADIRREANKMKKEYAGVVTKRELLDGIVKPTFDLLAAKEEEVITKEVAAQQDEVQNAVDRLDTMGIDEIISLSVKVNKLRGNVTAAKIAEDTRRTALTLCDTFNDKSRDILKASESAMIEQLEKFVKKQEATLAKMTKLSELNEWLATDYPSLKEQITHRQKQAPASHTKFMQKCLETETKLRELKDQYSKKFAEQYEEVRQQAVEKTDILGDIVEGRVDEFLEDLENQVQRGIFNSGDDARNYTEQSQLYQSALNSLDDLGREDADRTNHLRKRLKVKVAEIVHMVKRMKDIAVDKKTGVQMVAFGKAMMPKWEHKVKKHEEVKTELTFKVDERSKGPGVKPNEYYCELVLKVKDKSGKTIEIPFHEDDLRKYGLDNDRYYEDPMSSSYLSIQEAKKIIKAVKEMKGRRNTDLKKEYQEFRGRIKDVNGKILEAKKDWEGKWIGPKHAAETSEEARWQQLFDEREALTKEYINFIQESGLYAWLKVKNVQKKYEEVKEIFKNGQGFVPEIKSHWTRDPQTEYYLEQFAKNANLSLELRDGMISLEGHAGTGKDVLIEMFCAETNRPKFSFDCTKWTTEFELSQDVSLSAEGGASYTVKEDSIVVKALETPGAVLYFNEFNALPEQAQIFLHSLFDEKRQVTLKTSGGRVVKAHPTVIFCSSMNPGYRGTNDPQFATRSRMIPIKLHYPVFRRQNGTYGPSEALRMARSIDSLEDTTYDPDMQTNEFVNMWENYINKGDEGMMTPEQKFDMEVIFSLITFGNKLRSAFVKFVGKNAGPRDFKISQPFTGREMRRCAYVLSKISASQKNDPTIAENVAKNLIRRFYSQYIFDEKKAAELENLDYSKAIIFN